jgi:hypothetical protein
LATACALDTVAAALAAQARQWVEAAEAACPPEFSESFRHRNPVNVQWRWAWQGGAGLARGPRG